MTHRPAARINVTIDRLVLRGFAAGQRDAIAAGLVDGLRERWGGPAAAGAFGASRSLDSLRVRPINLAAETKPAEIGAQAGHAIARSTKP
jgi:hypothetical protein